jgi:hypothetical protein
MRKSIPYDKLCDCEGDFLALIMHPLFCNPAGCGLCSVHYPVEFLVLGWCRPVYCDCSV